MTHTYNMLKWDAPSRWSFSPDSTWDSIETTTIGKTQHTLVDIIISEQLWIKFDIAPSVGHIGLPLGTLADLNRQYRLDEFDSLQYCHDGSEAGFQSRALICAPLFAL